MWTVLCRVFALQHIPLPPALHQNQSFALKTGVNMNIAGAVSTHTYYNCFVDCLAHGLQHYRWLMPLLQQSHSICDVVTHFVLCCDADLFSSQASSGLRLLKMLWMLVKTSPHMTRRHHAALPSCAQLLSACLSPVLQLAATPEAVTHVLCVYARKFITQLSFDLCWQPATATANFWCASAAGVKESRGLRRLLGTTHLIGLDVRIVAFLLDPCVGLHNA
eukprot:GHUV01023160.1.p1 GENE.GHUV01023160.1~~GHUV01023160.1.p1  ORF type:complete len:220 (-),score=22.34 GHUV01023160.1:236-895(-)